MAAILVVEDYPPMASTLTRLLRDRGHRVARASTVAGAFELGSVFEYAVLDIDLPDGNGVSLAEELLNQRCVGHVVFFSATHEERTLTRAAQLGFVVNKAEGTRRLLEVVDELERPLRCLNERLMPKVSANTLVC
jgi:DNA-binding response OmpR family regulator